MDIGQATIAREALKPASSVIDSLLAPKLARLRRWAAERDLKNRIDGYQLETAFSSYMRRLFRRVSGINTLVFPQQVLPLPDLYEPLALMERHTRKSVAQAALTRKNARICIVDSAGMGKSTFVKNLIISQIGESDRIPLFLELRRVQPGETIFEALARDLDEFANTFDRDVLLRLLSVGRFLIVLDGFDEVALALRDALSRQIEELAVKGESSAIILTTRPEVGLPIMPGSRLLEIQPLTTEKAKSLIRRYDRVGDIEIGERLIRELDKAPERFLRTPLLIALLYKTYGFNGTISTRVSSFYDEVYSALYKGHDLSKAGFARAKASGLGVEDFRRLVRGFAFLLISRQIDSINRESDAIKIIDDAARLASVSPSSSSSFMEDLLLSVPLLVRDGLELRFLHKTIAEFFAAEYLAYAGNSEPIIKSIQKGALASRFNGVFDFLSEINPALFRKAVAAPLAHLVLRHEPEEKDLLFRTLRFLGEGHVMIAPESTPMKSLRRERTRQQDVYSIYHSISGNIVVLEFSRAEVVINRSAWNLVTSEIVLNFPRTVEIPATTPRHTWLKVEELSSILLGQHLVTIKYAIEDYTGVSANNDNAVRVLSNEAAQNLIESIKEEERTQEWLNTLIQDATQT